MLISRFDPWHGTWCTCPVKYSFSPYTGCSHACGYCYITSYVPDAFHARLKKDLFRLLKRELAVVDTYISMANSSDPYTPEEKELQATRKCLRIFRDNDIKVLVVTKSDLVARDADILSEMRASVSMTITTLDEEKARMMEPHAPAPSRRIAALRTLRGHGIPCSVRLDPIIPGINDGEIEEIIAAVAPHVSHIVSSTVKPRMDSMKRLENIIDVKSHRWKRYGTTFYLPETTRFSLLSQVEQACRAHHLSFAACRENYPFIAPSCDGSHLIPE